MTLYFCYCVQFECQVRNDKIKTNFSVLNCLSNARARAPYFRLSSDDAPKRQRLSKTRSRVQLKPTNRRRPELSKNNSGNTSRM